MGAWWSDLEPGPPVDGRHQYSWSDIDKQVVALARHNLQWEPLLCFSATWGSKIHGDYSAAPDGADNFGAFAGALARRYGRDGAFWQEHPELPALPVTAYEVWNEENAKLYWHPATPEEYADLYAASRSAIHQVDDSARVVVGGLAAANAAVQAPAAFLRQMYAHRPDLKGHVDAVALHPFAPEPQDVYDGIATFRADLDAIAGPGVPIELTEIGWTTVDTAERKRAAYVAELASTLWRTDCGIERFVPYAWLGPEQDPSDREQWFGIANRDGSNRPSATAYAQSVRRTRGLTGAPPTATVRICSASLRLTVTVAPHPRQGRLRVRARCSSSCRLRVELRVPPPRRSAPGTSPLRVAQRTTKSRARRHTVTVHVARSYRDATQLNVKVTAIGRHGLRATRSRTVHAQASTK